MYEIVLAQLPVAVNPGSNVNMFVYWLRVLISSIAGPIVPFKIGNFAVRPSGRVNVAYSSVG